MTTGDLCWLGKLADGQRAQEGKRTGGIMRYFEVGTKMVSVAAKIAGILFMIFLLAQAAPGGFLARLFATGHERSFVDEEPPQGPIR